MHHFNRRFSSHIINNTAENNKQKRSRIYCASRNSKNHMKYFPEAEIKQLTPQVSKNTSDIRKFNQLCDAFVKLMLANAGIFPKTPQSCLLNHIFPRYALMPLSCQPLKLSKNCNAKPKYYNNNSAKAPLKLRELSPNKLVLYFWKFGNHEPQFTI